MLCVKKRTLLQESSRVTTEIKQQATKQASEIRGQGMNLYTDILQSYYLKRFVFNKNMRHAQVQKSVTHTNKKKQATETASRKVHMSM